jgi:hypothetical protein
MWAVIIGAIVITLLVIAWLSAHHRRRERARVQAARLLAAAEREHRDDVSNSRSWRTRSRPIRHHGSGGWLDDLFGD